MTAIATQLGRSLPDQLDESEFGRIRLLAHEWAGINIEEQQRAMLYSRFCRRLRDLGLANFGEYIDYATHHENVEREFFVNTVTTNLTYFFREPHHFDHLTHEAAPALLNERPANTPLRIWSAACSSGQEPYSIAIALANSNLLEKSKTRILSTDINTKMVARTRSGVFHVDELRGLSPQDSARWFTRDDQHLIAKDELRQLILCNPLNLFGQWPFSVRVDVIFCRNALIYFNRDMQIQLINRFARTQQPGGYLYLGHSEVIRGIEKHYERIENTVYRRIP